MSEFKIIFVEWIELFNALCPKCPSFYSNKPPFDALASFRILATSNEFIDSVIERVKSETCRWLPDACALLLNAIFQRKILNVFRRDPHFRAVSAFG